MNRFPANVPSSRTRMPNPHGCALPGIDFLRRCSYVQVQRVAGSEKNPQNATDQLLRAGSSVPGFIPVIPITSSDRRRPLPLRCRPRYIKPKTRSTPSSSGSRMNHAKKTQSRSPRSTQPMKAVPLTASRNTCSAFA